MKYGRTAAWTLGIASALAAATPSHAALADWKGHLSLGYGKLFASEAPGGGFSVGIGLDYPIGAGLRIGPELGYHLLGTRSLVSGSLNANLDYSLVEVALLATWQPTHAGPLRRVSFGPALMGASAQVSSTSAGLAFENEDVSELRPGMALGLALLPAHATVVAVGLEIGAHVAFLSDEVWTVATTRLVLHY